MVLTTYLRNYKVITTKYIRIYTTYIYYIDLSLLSLNERKKLKIKKEIRIKKNLKKFLKIYFFVIVLCL